MLYFLTERRNATRLVWMAPHRAGGFDPVDRSFAWEMQSRRPDWVVLRMGPLVHGDGRGMGAQAPRLQEALVRGWEPRFTVGRFEIWGLRPG